MQINCTKHKTYIIGLSGGPDSVYLLHSLIDKNTEKKATLIAAHLDHEWRKDSYKDVEFCRALCKQLGVQFITKKASELGITVKHTGSKEDMGRKLRRHFFEQLAQEYNADAIVLGHHADDQLETFFIRLIRGTTIQGLSCMKEHDGLYWRPLLSVKKNTILAWLNAHNSAYLEDPTNASDDYLRNRIRSTLIPIYKTIDERSENTFERTLAHIQKAEQFLQNYTERVFKDLYNEKKELDFKKLLLLDTYIQKRVIQYWLAKEKVIHTLTQSFLDEIVRFLSNTHGGSHQLGTDWHLVKKQNKASILPLNTVVTCLLK